MDTTWIARWALTYRTMARCGDTRVYVPSTWHCTKLENSLPSDIIVLAFIVKSAMCPISHYSTCT
eukprot:scaffold213385_cov19-Prasinocladus_malaysianus.AAC.1